MHSHSKRALDLPRVRCTRVYLGPVKSGIYSSRNFCLTLTLQILLIQRRISIRNTAQVIVFLILQTIIAVLLRFKNNVSTICLIFDHINSPLSCRIYFSFQQAIY